MGILQDFFAKAFRILGLIFERPAISVSIIAIASTITFVCLSKSQKVNQKAFVRKVKKIKARQKAYNNVKDLSKLPKLESLYNKAVNALKRRIKYALWWNRKQIVLTDPYLLDESSNANLALYGKPSFTFKDVLNEIITAKNQKHKRAIQIIEKKAVSEIPKQVKSKEYKELQKPKAEISSLKTEANKIVPVEIKKSETDNSNMSSIYKVSKNDNEFTN